MIKDGHLPITKVSREFFRPEEEQEGCDDHPVEVPVLTFPAPKKNVLSQVISTKCYTVHNII